MQTQRQEREERSAIFLHRVALIVAALNTKVTAVSMSYAMPCLIERSRHIAFDLKTYEVE